MATASDDGDRTCPLCAEEMDLTDQQLKPCKCGYEICVWCWHHIMDMAEKDGTEGRCPACRTPYDKEKIVGMASNCERVVAEINSERRLKTQKAKSKVSEGRKHLSSVRVIHRNLVYIIGLPANLADEATLERREYFGQYGKVLKVSITRPSGGSHNTSNGNTCSVYITYTKEEEAVRCIQSVHGFNLEGKSLRACFGTTKYCHAWLRNMPCNNPDCLYLHDVGTPEDSFTKDEIISAYTRSRVQQITGAASNSQRLSGNVLPPPADDLCNYDSSMPSAKPIVKSPSNLNTSNLVKVSPNSNSSGSSSILPAAASWGLRVSSSCHQPTASTACLQGPVKTKADTLNSLATASAASNLSMASELDDPGRRTQLRTKEIDQVHHLARNVNGTPVLGATKHIGYRVNSDSAVQVSTRVSKNADCATTTDYPLIPLENKDGGAGKRPRKESENFSRLDFCGSSDTEFAHGSVAVDDTIKSVSSELSSMHDDDHLSVSHSDLNHCGRISDQLSTLLDHKSASLQENYSGEKSNAADLLSSLPLRKAVQVSESSCVYGEMPTWNTEFQKEVLSTSSYETNDKTLPLDDNRLELKESTNSLSYMTNSSKLLEAAHLGHSSEFSGSGNGSILGSPDPKTVTTQVNAFLPFAGSVLSNGYATNKSSIHDLGYHGEQCSMPPNRETVYCSERFKGNASGTDGISCSEMVEDNIISSILSLDLDASDDCPQSLAKFFGNTNPQKSYLNLSSPWKLQNISQSRFSFARQEEYLNQSTHSESSARHGFCLGASFGNSGNVLERNVMQDFIENRDASWDLHRNGFTFNGLDVSQGLINNLIPSNVTVSRAQISAPPGFSVPRRSPPPGFPSQERVDQTVVSTSAGNQLLENPLSMKQYQATSAVTITDVEFIDPAILAVGKGTLPLAPGKSGLDLASCLSAQLNASENDLRLRLLMQQSLSTYPDLRLSDHLPNRYSMGGSYSRFVEHTQGNTLSPLAQISHVQYRNSQMLNRQWDTWTEAQTSNDMVLPEILRNERLGLAKYYPGHEELKFHMSNSGDLYNGAFGM